MEKTLTVKCVYCDMRRELTDEEARKASYLDDILFCPADGGPMIAEKAEIKP